MESYNVLLDIIRDLIRNPQEGNRQDLENRIEKQFSQSSDNLDSLLQKSSEDIFSIITLYSDVQSHLHWAQTRGQKVRQDLSRCCQLLQLKRDELRSLYIGHVELESSVKLLSQIRDLSAAPARIQNCLAVDDYLGAANELTSAERTLNTELLNVKSLFSVKTELTVLSRTIFQSLLSNLAYRLYFYDHGMGPVDFDSLGGRDLSQVPSLNLSEAENAILSLLEAAYHLNKLPQTVQNILDNLNASLRDIVNRRSEAALAASSSFKGFMTGLLAHLQQVAYRHTIFAKRLNLLVLRSPSLGQSPSVACYHEENPVLTAMGAELKELLSDYLDVRGANVGYDSAPSGAAAQIDVNQLLAKRRPQAKPAPVLFRFSYSSHAVSMAHQHQQQQGQQQQQQAGSGRQQKLSLVCPPAQANIVEVYDCLAAFTSSVDPGDQLELGGWLRRFVCDTFLHNEHSRMLAAIGQDPMSVVLPRARAPLLQSCVTLYSFLSDLARYARQMVGQAEQSWAIARDLLHQYQAACQNALKALTQEQMCTAASKDLLAVVAKGDLDSEDGVRAVTASLIDHLFYKTEHGLREPRPIRELRDVAAVCQVATLYESLSWLVAGAQPLLPSNTSMGTGRRIRETLEQLKALGEKCFSIVLVELCLRAANRLKDLPTHSNFSVGVDDIELDDRVTVFLADLRSLKSGLRSALAAASMTKAFRLLPGVVCSLVTILLPSFSRINPLGVKKIGRNLFEMQRATVALAHCGESGFARVRELFDLLLLTPDQIVASVLEQGPRFSQQEYDAVLRVYARTYSSYDEEKVRKARDKLHQVIAQRHV